MGERGLGTPDGPNSNREPPQGRHPRHGPPRQTRSRSPPRYASQNSYRDRRPQHQQQQQLQPRQWQSQSQRSRPLLNDIGSLFRVDLEKRDPDNSARSFRIVPTTHDGGCRFNTVGQTLNGATKVAIIHNRESLMAWADRMAAALEERGPGGELTIISTLGNMQKQHGNRTVVERWDGSGLFCAPSATTAMQHNAAKASRPETPRPNKPSLPAAANREAARPNAVVRMPQSESHPYPATADSKYMPDSNLMAAPGWQLCHNCKGLGHYPAYCAVPGPSGFTHVCPLCNSTSHLVDECVQWYEKTIWQRMDILVRNRAGKPPLATVERSWPNLVAETKNRMAFNPPHDWVEITEYPLDFQAVQRIISTPDCPQTVWMSHERFSAHLAHIGARSVYTPRFLEMYQVAHNEQVYSATRM
ncbi:hypothetical protein ACHAQH_004987 [Verticillium albo-atrum]